MTHELRREQWLPVPVETAWEFMSSPRNLERITPREMAFSIRELDDEQGIRPGQRITYTVKPVLGIPLRWVTRIPLVEAPHRFVDEQEKGPYAYWRHEHILKPQGQGTLMEDIVTYRLPLGPLGSIAHRIFVKRRLESIFAYRKLALERIFPEHISMSN